MVNPSKKGAKFPHQIEARLTSKYISGWWLSGGIPTPLKNDGVRQLG